MKGTTTAWAADELKRFRNDPEFELETLLLDINEQIVAEMVNRGWRRSDLAARLGVSRAFVTKLLGGNGNLTLGTLVKIANALEMKVELGLLPRYMESWEVIPVGFDMALLNQEGVIEGERQILLAA
ncbi:MAG: helix-turn-helix domain-containing protein [Dehalococcoidia bacterium]|nr:helix-turn-helix domain-containing protein [Dehalococcoidia bacterium]